MLSHCCLSALLVARLTHYAPPDTVMGVQGRVTFENVSFAYPLRPESNVLHELNLDVAPGKVPRWMWRLLVTGCLWPF